MKPTNWLILFFSIFGIYLFTVAPSLPPYRDAGEMTSVLYTLGVAHPPGYPLYILVGQLTHLIPFGNFSYQVNIFSGIMGALAVLILIRVLLMWLNKPGAILGGGFFGFSTQFWELSLVPEMYTFGILMIVMILWALFVKENYPLASFLFGLSLGVRMDLLLFAPLFLILVWPKKNQVSFVALGLSFLTGLTIFLYLYVRSKTDPLLDWGNPETLTQLFNSVRRKSYGGTLDLLSTNYSVGENFLANMMLYGKQVVRDFTWLGPILIIMGALHAYRTRKLFWFLFASFLIFGPFFLFLANMPPNPHSVAIVEANYLVPQIFLSIFLGFGVSRAVQFKFSKWIPLFIIIIVMSVNATAIEKRVSRRNNFYVQDFLTNTSRSVPRGRLAIFHDDVQLFSLWDYQLIRGKRRDMPVVASGLSSSAWYWTMKNRWPVKNVTNVNLKKNGAFEELSRHLQGNPYYVGYETPYTGGNTLITYGRGLMLAVSGNVEKIPLNDGRIQDLGLFRGTYIYEKTPDFFSSDLISDLARAHYRIGFDNFKKGNLNTAEWHFRRAESLDPIFVRPTSDRGLIYYQQGKYRQALSAHEWAIEKGEELVRRLNEYNSLPDVSEGIYAELANAWVNAGAAWEKMGELKSARGAYQRSIEVQNNFQGQYNLAVNYWNQDWGRVIFHLENALKLQPNNQQAAAYLDKARQMKNP